MRHSTHSLIRTYIKNIYKTRTKKGHSSKYKKLTFTHSILQKEDCGVFNIFYITGWLLKFIFAVPKLHINQLPHPTYSISTLAMHFLTFYYLKIQFLKFNYLKCYCYFFLIEVNYRLWTGSSLLCIQHVTFRNSWKLCNIILKYFLQIAELRKCTTWKFTIWKSRKNIDTIIVFSPQFLMIFMLQI